MNSYFKGTAMDQNGFNSFDDLINFCRNLYEQQDNNSNENSQENSEKCNDCMFGNSNANASETSRNAFTDIPGGFQDANPQLLNLIATIIANMTAQNLPFNVQNIIGNWLQLLGQAILTFNAQQQYHQGGPGRIYSPIYRNAANPFCSDGSDESQANISTSRKKTYKNKTKYNRTTISDKSIKELKNSIEELNNEIIELKRDIEELKKKTY